MYVCNVQVATIGKESPNLEVRSTRSRSSYNVLELGQVLSLVANYEAAGLQVS